MATGGPIFITEMMRELSEKSDGITSADYLLKVVRTHIMRIYNINAVNQAIESDNDANAVINSFPRCNTQENPFMQPRDVLMIFYKAMALNPAFAALRLDAIEKGRFKNAINGLIVNPYAQSITDQYKSAHHYLPTITDLNDDAQYYLFSMICFDLAKITLNPKNDIFTRHLNNYDLHFYLSHILNLMEAQQFTAMQTFEFANQIRYLGNLVLDYFNWKPLPIETVAAHFQVEDNTLRMFHQIAIPPLTRARPIPEWIVTESPESPKTFTPGHRLSLSVDSLAPNMITRGFGEDVPSSPFASTPKKAGFGGMF